MGLKIRFVKNYYYYNYYPKEFSFQGSQQPVHLGSDGSPASLPVCLACTHPRHHPPGPARAPPQAFQCLHFSLLTLLILSSWDSHVQTNCTLTCKCWITLLWFICLFVYIFTCFLTFFSRSRH